LSESRKSTQVSPCLGGVKLEVKGFVASVALLAWAKDNGCPWTAATCAAIAENGKLEALEFARSHDRPCPWDWRTCASAAQGGHLAMLKRARELGCPWNTKCCARAAGGGHLEVLQWARAVVLPWTACPWGVSTAVYAARGGHLPVGPARYCSPPQEMLLKSRTEASDCVG
jgi:hypothetical protein